MTTIETAAFTALVPVERPAERSWVTFNRPRPDAPFVTQLIATAAGASQTRLLRRGTHADAVGKYGNVIVHEAKPLRQNGIRISLVA